MRSLDFDRYVLGSMVTAAMLAGCGALRQAQGDMPPVGTPDALPQRPAVATHAEHGGSWMLPEAQNEDLIYASRHVTRDCDDCTVDVYALQTGKAVGALRHLPNPQRLCSDAKGNVWVTEDLGGYEVGPGRIVKYPHAGTKPIETLAENDTPAACSVERSTDNLAVLNSSQYSHSLAVFMGGRGEPKFYGGASVPSSVTYDTHGDIFMVDLVDTYSKGIEWLPKGAEAIKYFPTKPRVFPRGGVFWQGQFLTVNGEHPRVGRYAVVDGKSGKEVGTTQLYGAAGTLYQYSIANNVLVAAGSDGIQVWKYPAGGNLVRTIDAPAFGIAVSFATVFLNGRSQR
jgi:hypothetical protein